MFRKDDESEAISEFFSRYLYFLRWNKRFHFARPEFGFISLKG